MPIDFEVNQKAGAKIPLAFWQKLFSRLGSELKLKTCSVSLALVGDQAIRTLNRQYRQIDKITDVLSFGQLDLKGRAKNFDRGYLGEIVICYPQAVRQAKTAKVLLKKELEFLTAHGLLHLLGHDHEKPKEAEIMFKLQDKLIGD